MRPLPLSPRRPESLLEIDDPWISIVSRSAAGGGHNL
jgi:hypothetical protein